MATQTTGIPGSGYGNTYLDSLIWGCGWTGIDTPIRYWFGSGAVAAADSSIGAFTGAAWTGAEQSAFEAALAEYSSVCGLTFTEADSASAADIAWWLVPESAMGTGVLGMHEVPDGSSPQVNGYFNYQDPSWQYLDQGQYGYVTIIHELGHGMGLAHPHDGGGEADATIFPGVNGPWSTGTYGLNQGIWTTMSYNDGWNKQPSPSDAYGWQGTLMAFDIAALQKLYGANETTATGNNTYELPDALATGTYWSCIWDAAGVDTISNEDSILACTINLNAAPLVGANAGGYVSWNKGIPGGFTIANGVVIENATGGQANDVLLGNAADNVLNGGAGADTMTGGLGNDTYVVDNRKDKVAEGKSSGSDTEYLSVSGLTLAANVENAVLLDAAGAARVTGNNLDNLLQGNTAANMLAGGAGADTLAGGAGGDTLAGGRGADTFVFASLADMSTGAGLRDVVTDFNAGQGDKIDLSAVAAFAYIGAAGFSDVAGQLRFSAGILSGDVNGDGVADFEIQLTGVRSFDTAALVA